MKRVIVILFIGALATTTMFGQGVTTSSMTGLVTTDQGEPLPGANVIAVHEPTGTKYGAPTRVNGQFDIQNMRIGGPYTVTVSHIGYKTESQKDLYLRLGQATRIDFKLVEEAIQGKEVVITAENDPVLNPGRTGAATFINPDQVSELPSVKRSTRDLTRLDPRSDGNFSFGGRNWLYNNISLDGSYFNNPYGLDDPAPGGQAGAEPVPFDAVEQVQVSVAPFDVREGGFTGAGINTVTKSGTNDFKGSLYSFFRNEHLLGNTVRGAKVVANPSLSFNQSGYTVSGPVIPNTLFFFMNGETERREDPGSDFAAFRGTAGPGVSRVKASTMDSIRQRMMSVYGYDPGAYEGFVHHTDNEKLLLKLDWNANEDNNLTFRFDYLNARRGLPPHPFVLSYGNTGRGPNENSLPFSNAGYTINNHLNSFSLEANSRLGTFGNRFFASYNRFRDYRDPFSRPFPTIEIAQDGVTYTTLGHEPFSIHNILDQDVWQFTDNFSYFAGNHVITVGGNFEKFSFFNAFNIFRYGVFFLPPSIGGTTYSSVAEFFRYTDPTDTLFRDFNAEVTAEDKAPYKGEDISVGQLAFYGQDEFLVSKNFSLTYGLRVDFPMYFNDLVDNPFSRSLKALDADGNPEIVDQSKLPGAKPLFSPRIGFNWNATGDRSTQLRGGTGIFTGRLPFVWIGNAISNPGQNPNLPSYERSFDVNAIAPNFKWPQVWTTDLALDQKLPWDMLGTVELLYGKDINAIYVRNANLPAPVRYLPDGRPYYGGSGLNPGFFGGIYVIDNTSDGYNYTITGQLRKTFDIGLATSLSYTYLIAKNQMKSTEIAFAQWGGNPVMGNPNKPEVSYSEFGERQRIVGSATYRHSWSENLATSIGLFVEVAEGNRFAGAGGNRYSFVYSGDVNGDGSNGNDLIYIPKNASDIQFDPYTPPGGATVSAAEQAAAFNAFIEQDDYLRTHRGQIAERFGALNPWFSNIDVRVLQDITFQFSGQPHTFELSLDVLNFANVISSDWGVRSGANAAATSPLELVRFDGAGAPVFNYKATATKTFTDDPGLNSRWQMQLGVRYLFNR
ncbi:MAG TPA: carboxypeptidase regulatory-like domain-containing protein [Bacteroidota bacterium]|nr:carboxypeptidase regulatory-like domain-containing protein [Bacteroidota bacterium]